MTRIVLALACLMVLAPLPAAANVPYLVKDINERTLGTGSYPDRFITMGGLTFFVTRTHGSSPPQLWRSDGTETGTFPLAPGGWEKAVWNNRLWFISNTREIWSTDGTVAGTQKFLPSPTHPDINATRLMPVAGHLYFASSATPFGNTGLWRTDGTMGGTQPASETLFNFTSESLYGPTWTASGSTLFFAAAGSSGGHALWRSDLAGTSMVSSPQPPAIPNRVNTADGLVFFVMGPDSASVRVWRSDGTPGGTFPLQSSTQTNIALRSDTLNYLVSGSHVYFVGDDGSGPKLWRTDGTNAGTVALASSIPGISNGFSASLLGFLPNGLLLFDARDSSFRVGLYAFDGASTTFLGQLGEQSVRSSPATVAGNLMFFGSGQNLWRTDGTAAGSVSLGTFEPSYDLYYNWPMAALGSEVLFGADGDEFGMELWKTDGSIANTNRLKDLVPATEASQPTGLIAFRGGVLFWADDGLSGLQYPIKDLWFSDGTSGGTLKLVPELINLSGLVPCGRRTFFSHNSAEAGYELWSTDGTILGTAMVKDIFPGMTGTYANSSGPNKMTCVDGTLLFIARSSFTYAPELWRSDGTAAGTVMVRPLPAASSDSIDTALTTSNHQAFWGMRGGGSPNQLWRSDGTGSGTEPIKDVPCTFFGRQIATISELYFNAYDCAREHTLWRSDGSTAGTNEFLRDHYFAPLGHFQDRLVFNWQTVGPIAYESLGTCLTDGTEAGTRCFDAYGSYSDAHPLNGRLYYLAQENLRSSDGFTFTNVGLTRPREIFSNGGGRLYLTAEVSGRDALVETDGTLEGSQVVMHRRVNQAVASGGRLFIALDEVYAYDFPVTPTSFAPGTVGEFGGETVIISGRGFTVPATITVGGIAATVLEVSETAIRFTAPPRQAGTYPVVLTLGDGRQITLDEPLRYTCSTLTASITSAPATVCPFAPVTLQGAGAARCSWFPAIGLDNSDSCTPTVSIDKTTTYTLIVESESGCESTNHPSTTITIHPIADATILASTWWYEANTVHTVSVADAGSGATYLWTVEGAEIVGATNERNFSFRTGCADVQLRATVTNALGCSSSSTRSLGVSFTPALTSATPTLIQPGALITAVGTQLTCLDRVAFRTAFENYWMPTTYRSETLVQFRAPAIPPRSSRILYSTSLGSWLSSWFMRRASRSDFTGDTAADILLQHSNSGAIKQWEMFGGTIHSDKVVAYLGPDWQVRALGDFDSDGKTDIVIQNSVNGQIAVWLMNGAAVKAGAIIASIGTAWRPVTAGDFNGDGKSDILLQNQTSGEIAQWQMDGVSVTAGAIIASLGTSWTPRVAGDSNGDGKADIILRNQATGAIAQWQMDGFNVAAGALLSTVGSTWDVRAAGDFNQDGLADLLLQSNYGDIALWHLNGSTVTAGGRSSGVSRKYLERHCGFGLQR